MGGILKDINMTVVSAETSTTDFISLREMLLGETKKVKEKPTSSSYNKTSAQKKIVQSRRQQRKKLKSKSTPKASGGYSPAELKKIRFQEQKRAQEANTKYLKAYEKNKKKESPNSGLTAGTLGLGDLFASLDPPSMDGVSNSDYKGSKNPVILGAVDWDPVYQASKLTTAGVGLTYKRVVKMLNVDQLVQENTDNLTMSDIELADALESHVKAKTEFFDTLALSRGSNFIRTAMDALSIPDGQVSDTQLLYTILRDFAASLDFSSANIDELPMRHNDNDPNDMSMIKVVNGTSRKSLRSLVQPFTALKDPVDGYRRMIPKDTELALKSISNIIGKDTLFSSNIARNPEEFGLPSPEDKKTPKIADRTKVNAHKILNITEGTSMMGGPMEKLSDGFLPLSGHGTVFTRKIASTSPVGIKRVYGTNSVVFPYETRFVMNSAAADEPGAQEVSAHDLIEELYQTFDKSYQAGLKKYGVHDLQLSYMGAEDKMYDNPYQASFTRMNAAVGRINKMAKTFQGDSFASPLSRLLKPTFENIELSLRLNKKRLDAMVLSAAAQDSGLFVKLLIYLAFRQERSQKYDGTGIAPAGPSQLLRRSSYLQKDGYISRSSGKSTMTKTTAVDPANIKVDPAVGGQTSFTAPEKPTTVTFEVPADGSFNAGTLESIFGRSFEDISDFFATDLARHYNRTGAKKITEALAKDKQYAGTQGDMALDRKTIRAALEEINNDSIFDEITSFESFLNGYSPADQESSIFDTDQKTFFNQVDREALFAAFAKMACFMHELITPKLFVVISKEAFDDGYEIKPTSSFFRMRSGYFTRVSAMINWRNDNSQTSRGKVTASLRNNFPEIARVMDAIKEEQANIQTVAALLAGYYADAAVAYATLLDTLEDSIRLTNGENVSLGRLFAEGLRPSTDLIRLLKQYPIKLNEDHMYHGGKKTNDPSISDDMHDTMLDFFKLGHFSSDGKGAEESRRVLAVGLPVGLLDQLDQVRPDDSGTADAYFSSNSSEFFNLAVERIDNARPSLKFTPKKFKFCRRLFPVAPRKSTGDIDYVYFLNNGRATRSTASRVMTIFQSMNKNSLFNDVHFNNSADFFLKNYMNVQHDLDFEENSFPATVDVLEPLLDKRVEIPALSFVDTEGKEFLSGSNLAYDPEKVKFKDLPFYSEESIGRKDFTNPVLDTTKKDFDDAYYYSAFDYAHTYGALFDPKSEMRRLEKSVIFERTLCVAFDDLDFDVDTGASTKAEYINLTNARAHASKEARFKMAQKNIEDQVKSLFKKQQPAQSMISYRVYVERTSEKGLSVETKGGAA